MEQLLGAVAEAILGVLISELAQQPWMIPFREKLRGESPERVALQSALAASYLSLSSTYPHMVSSFFDEHFLMRPTVINELSKILTPNYFPSREIIKSEWEAQFSKTPNIDLTAPLNDFLAKFSSEIKAKPLLKPFTDSRALDQLYKIATSVEDQAIQQRDVKLLLQEVRDLIMQANQHILLEKQSSMASKKINQDVTSVQAEQKGRYKIIFRLADNSTRNILSKQKPTIKLNDRIDLLSTQDIANWFLTSSFAVYRHLNKSNLMEAIEEAKKLDQESGFDNFSSMRASSIKYLLYSAPSPIHKDTIYPLNYSVSVGLYHPFDKGYGHLNGRVLAARLIICEDIDEELKKLQPNTYYVCEIH